MDSGRLRHGTASRTSIFGPHLHNGYLDKVLSVAEGKERRTFTYHADGQLATATRTGGPRSVAAATGRAASPLAAEAETETFLWDGLALIRRGSTAYVNEPHPGGGAAVASSKDGIMFNDILGTTLGTESSEGYAPVEMTVFGDASPSHLPTSSPSRHLFTGKPDVEGLGYAFLFRNYRAGLGKWQTADPLGYPDGWNHMAYGVNSPLEGFDLWGTRWAQFSFGMIRSCEDLVYILGPGTPIGGINPSSTYRVGECIFNLIARLIANQIKGGIEAVGLADFLNTYINAVEAEGLGAAAIEPTDAECLARAREILVAAGATQKEIGSLELIDKEALSMDYSASQVNNLIEVDRVEVLWLIHVRYWTE